MYPTVRKSRNRTKLSPLTETKHSHPILSYPTAFVIPHHRCLSYYNRDMPHSSSQRNSRDISKAYQRGYHQPRDSECHSAYRIVNRERPVAGWVQTNTVISCTFVIFSLIQYRTSQFFCCLLFLVPIN